MLKFGLLKVEQKHVEGCSNLLLKVNWRLFLRLFIVFYFVPVEDKKLYSHIHICSMHYTDNDPKPETIVYSYQVMERILL